MSKLKQTLFIQQKDEANKSHSVHQLNVDDKTSEFKPISPESLDDNRISSVIETSELGENNETREKTADRSYVEGEAKALDLSTGKNQLKNLFEAKLNDKLVLYFDVFKFKIIKQC